MDLVSSSTDMTGVSSLHSFPPKEALAPTWRRALAFSLDCALLAPLLLLIGWLWVETFDITAPRQGLPLLDWGLQLVRGDDPLVIGGLLVGLMAWSLYQVVFTVLFATTPGLALVGTHIVNERGAAPGPGQALARVAGSVLSALVFWLGYLFVVFDSGRQGLHDKVAGTYVTKSKIV